MSHKPATPAARKLFAKLTALATAPGTADEGKAAQAKLDRLKARYDFTLPDVTKEGLFAGRYQSASDARPVLNLPDLTLVMWVKWAIEESTGIACLLRGSELFAQATPRTAEKLAGIGRTIAEGFTGLWVQFRSFPRVRPDDHGLFMRGLYDGMMAQVKDCGQQLPARVVAPKLRKAKRAAVNRPSGIELHPYSVAVELGKQIRFNVPLPEVVNQLEALRPMEIAG